jgi:hypothetical protein
VYASATRIEAQAVITALQGVADHSAERERYQSMRAAILQGMRYAGGVTKKDDTLFEEHAAEGALA